MTVYTSYPDGVLNLRFDDITSTTLGTIKYNYNSQNLGKLYISHSSGYYYNLNNPNLTQAKIIFADGVQKNLYITPENGKLTTTSASEILVGTTANDTLTGGAGNDQLYGGDGNDTYIFAKGHGKDVVEDFSGTNIIKFSDLHSSDARYEIKQGALHIYSGNGDSVTIENFLSNNKNNFTLQFTDKTISADQVDAEVGIQYWVRGLVASNNTDTDFKYNFPTSMPSYLNSYETTYGWQPLTQSAINYLLSRFDQIAGYTGLTFTPTSNLTANNVITAQMNTNTEGASGFAYYPGSTAIGSDIFFDKGYTDDPTNKTWQKYVFPHELGHALGLRHSFEAPNLSKWASAEESSTYTTMSYNTVSYSDGDFKDFDIAALQAMYGVNTSARVGNDTYSFSNTGGVFVWDGAGIDTISAASQNLNAYIDLRQGSWSYLGTKTQHISSVNQLTINLGTKIENATGGKGNDILIGNELDNVLNGGAGADTMRGGYGNDIYYVDNVNDIIIEKKDQGSDKVYSTVSYSLNVSDRTYIEYLELLGTANINATGSRFSNRLVGNSGDNILDGGADADMMIGGKGNDTYYVDHVNDKIIENKGEGTDKVYASVSYSLNISERAYVEYLELTGAANINATGSRFANRLVGNSGDNILNGGADADMMIGGKGNDTYYVDHVNDKIIENKDEGTDKVYSLVSYSLNVSERAYVEYLELTGTANINATGSRFGNRLVGNSGDNLLDGAAGNDNLTGGLGSDTAIYRLLTASDATGGNGKDVWTDFKVGKVSTDAHADKIDISSLLIGYNGKYQTSVLDQYLTVQTKNNDTLLYIDRDGGLGNYTDTLFLTLNNVNTSLDELIKNQQIIV